MTRDQGLGGWWFLVVVLRIVGYREEQVNAAASHRRRTGEGEELMGGNSPGVSRVEKLSGVEIKKTQTRQQKQISDSAVGS